MAVRALINGKVEAAKPKNPSRGFEYDEMNAAVDGYIEFVYFPETFKLLGERVNAMIVNEEGLLDGLALNSLATEVYHEFFSTFNPIVGNVLFVLLENPGSDDERIS